jgi:hypothetical protein
MRYHSRFSTLIAVVGYVFNARLAAAHSLDVEIAPLAQRTLAMRIGETSPRSIDAPGIAVQMGGYLVGLQPWIGSSVGGSWQRIHGPDFDARLSYVEWAVCTGIGSQLAVSPTILLDAGVYFDYSETNSWLRNLAISQSGPKTIQAGGGIQLRLVTNPRGAVRPIIAMTQSVCRAHSNESSSGREGAWIGARSSIRAGIEFVHR